MIKVRRQWKKISWLHLFRLREWSRWMWGIKKIKFRKLTSALKISHMSAARQLAPTNQVMDRTPTTTITLITMLGGVILFTWTINSLAGAWAGGQAAGSEINPEEDSDLGSGTDHIGIKNVKMTKMFKLCQWDFLETNMYLKFWAADILKRWKFSEKWYQERKQSFWQHWLLMRFDSTV